MATDRPLRIAYLCDSSPFDPHSYSGGNMRMHAALQRHAGNVTVMSPSWYLAEPVRRLILRSPARASLRLRWRMHYALARLIAPGLRAALIRGRYDVVFGAYSLQSMYRLVIPHGMVTAFTSDAIQTVYRDSEVGAVFERVYGVGRHLDDWVERCEGRALRRADLLLWPSEWLHEAVARRYAVPSSKMHVVPWGANLDYVPEVAPKRISRDKPVHLLVLGRDWQAKGGPTAFAVAWKLRAAGIDARLTVIGCMPPAVHRAEWVTCLGHLDKRDPVQMTRFTNALQQAHFLIQPSHESYGFAFCEASAYGLPSLCLRVGGVPVWTGENGDALPADATPLDFARVVRSYLDHPDRYQALSLSTRTLFEARLNWDAWGESVAGLLRRDVARQRFGQASLPMLGSSVLRRVEAAVP